MRFESHNAVNDISNHSTKHEAFSDHRQSDQEI